MGCGRVFVIYDTETCDVFEMHFDGSVCMERFTEMYDGLVNVNCAAININEWLIDHEIIKKRGGYCND